MSMHCVHSFTTGIKNYHKVLNQIQCKTQHLELTISILVTFNIHITFLTASGGKYVCVGVSVVNISRKIQQIQVVNYVSSGLVPRP